MGEKLRNYSYVSARLVDPEEGVITDIRQGIYLATLQDHTILIVGESGKVYRCTPDATEIPDENLSGNAKHLAQTLRDLNR